MTEVGIPFDTMRFRDASKIVRMRRTSPLPHCHVPKEQHATDMHPCVRQRSVRDFEETTDDLAARTGGSRGVDFDPDDDVVRLGGEGRLRGSVNRGVAGVSEERVEGVEDTLREAAVEYLVRLLGLCRSWTHREARLGSSRGRLRLLHRPLEDVGDGKSSRHDGFDWSEALHVEWVHTIRHR